MSDAASDTAQSTGIPLADTTNAMEDAVRSRGTLNRAVTVGTEDTDEPSAGVELTKVSTGAAEGPADLRRARPPRRGR